MLIDNFLFHDSRVTIYDVKYCLIRLFISAKVVDKATQQLKKSNKQIHMTVLDSDDESLAEYMGGLSSNTVSGEKKRLVSSNAKVGLCAHTFVSCLSVYGS
jgi:hypothetical protein